MKEKTKQWSWNDGWIVMSIYLVQAKEVTTLADIISAADATNHAIPTANELSNAITKLVNAGLLDILHNNYKIKEEYIDAIGCAYKRKGGLFKSAQKGQDWLNHSKFKVIKKPRITITNDEVTTEYEIYSNTIGKRA